MSGLLLAGLVSATNTVTQPSAFLSTIQVNPKAFNAYNIWNEGQGTEILSYPPSYSDDDKFNQEDGVFYVSGSEYFQDYRFVGVPTEGAKVLNDVLEYPQKNGMQLKLRFSTKAEKDMEHIGAVQYCEKLGLRLPTIRELFDFCTAGVSEPNYGPDFLHGKYPSTARCAGGYIWSASMALIAPIRALQLNGYYGKVNYTNRSSRGVFGVRCVGGE